MSASEDSLFLHKSFKKAMSYLLYVLQNGEGMIMITGESGVGKTRLIENLKAETNDPQMPITVVDCTHLLGEDLLEYYLEGLGAKPGESASRALNVSMIRQILTDLRKDKQSVLVLDNAHLLSTESLEIVHMLYNMNSNGLPLVQIVLIGQSSLREVMLSPCHEQLHQRLIATCNIESLDQKESRDYVTLKLKAAGWTNSNPAISEKVYGVIYSSSLGVPRWIDLISSRMLLNGMASDKQEITLEDACEVVQDLISEDLLPDQVRLMAQKAA